MASRNPVTVTGNLAADPESFVAGATSGVRLLLVENIGYKDRSGVFVEESPMFWPVTIWDDSLAKNVLASVRKGARLTVTGRYRNNTWEQEDGQKRSRLELAADEVAVSLRWASAVITRNASLSDVALGLAPAAADAPPF